MSILHNVGDWFVLRPDTYRKIDLLTPEWPLDLELHYMHVVGAPFGGPVAMIRDPNQIVPIKGISAKPLIRIFDTAGRELSKILWNHGKLIAMGWSDKEELICVQDDALVFVYDMFGNEKESYSMGQEASLTKIIAAKIFQSYAGTGVAVMTTNERIFLKLKNKNDFRSRQLPEMPKSDTVSTFACWEIVTEDRNSYCLVARERDVIKLYPGESVGSITRNFFEKEFRRILLMSVSYNHQNLALYTDTGLLWLGSVDMKKKFCEFATGRKDIPQQIEWIMNAEYDQADAVVISYPTEMLVVNRNADEITYDPAVHLIAEMDGVRILTSKAHEMLQRLPKCVHNIFAVYSQDPSSFLFGAYKKFQDKSHESDEYLSLCRDRMDIAVDECIEAAGYEFCPQTQKSLLKTAYFGKGFIPSHNPDEYMRMLRILRVLNTLRHPKIAMPLTYKQFSHLKPEVILGRLVFRKHYAIAIQVAKHLKLPESWILEHWAYHKVLNDKNDSEVARKITEKFKNPSVEGISFCNIAEKAHVAGRDELAIKLLELEPCASLQVPLLLKLGKYDRAIQSATQSGDTELVITVVLEIKNKMMLTNFHMIIREYPMALNLYKKMHEWSRTALYDIFNTEDDHKSIAEYHFRNAIESDSLESNLSTIANSYTQGRRHVEAELCAETQKIMKLQKALATKYAPAHGQIAFYGMSIHDTILQLLQMGELREAEKIKSDYKVPDRRFWWLRIRTLSEKYKWDDLEKFAKSKKSPIGYEPFVEVCLKQNNLHEARKYILKCRDDRKAHWYMRAELYEEAVECAFEQRDTNMLYVVQQKANLNSSRVLLEKINAYIALLAAKK